MNAASALLLRDILREPLDVVAASRALSAALPEGEALPEGLADYVSAILHRFEALGLVERVA